MMLKIVGIPILAVAAIAVPYYFLNDGSVKNEAQLNNATEAAKHREAAVLQCIARVEAEYVADVQREYSGGPLKTSSTLGLNPEIRDQIEHKKETAAADCQKE